MEKLSTLLQSKQWRMVLLTISVLCFSPGIFAQLNGTYTIGTGGDYTTFSDAATALNNNGVSGPVTFNVQTGIYNEQVILDFIPGADENKAVVFQSGSGEPADVVLQSEDATFSDNYVLKLKRLSYVTFRNITFKTLNDTYSQVVQIEDYGIYLIFSSCIFEGNYSTQNNKRSLLTGEGVSLEDILIENNKFLMAGDGIKFNCSGKNNLRPRILNNEFDSIGYTSISLFTSDNAIISGNRVSGGYYGFNMSTAIGRAKITKNRLLNIAGTGMNFNALRSSDGYDAEISNNEISANENGKIGLSITNSYYFKLLNNTIFINSDYFLSKVLYLNHCTGSTIEIVNNNFVSEKAGYAVYAEYTGDFMRCDYNNYYSPGRLLAYWDPGVAGVGEECEDLRTLKMKSNDNVNSIFAFPYFESDTVLKPRSAWLDNMGKMLMMNDNDDIDGNIRGNPPDIGSYEFTASDNVKPPLHGTITIGSGEYATLQDAVNDARIKGVSDSLKIQFPSGTYDMQCIITPITGASSKHPVIIESVTGSAEDVTIQYDAEGYDDNYLMILNGSSFLQFRNLTFKALDDRYCLLFKLKGMLDSLKFNNCILTGKPISQAGTNIIESDDDINFHYQEYTGNTFIYGRNPIKIYLSNPPSKPGILKIENNIFKKNVQETIYLSKVNSAFISGNEVDSAAKGFSLIRMYNEVEINNNNIKVEYGPGININGCHFSSSNPGRIYNNFVSVYSDHPNGQGIFVNFSDTIEIYYNSVYINPQGTPYSSHIYSSLKIDQGHSIEMQNNILFNKGLHYALSVNNSTISASDYNCYYSEGTNLAYWDRDCADLNELKDVSGSNENSVRANPIFVSPVDLHASSAFLDSAAVPITWITEDIDGDMRDTNYPDIGADEFGAGPGNHPPIAVNDTVSIEQGFSVKIAVLINDSDPDGDEIHLTHTGTPAEGQVTSAVNDTVTYLTPMTKFTGMDSVKYYIEDSNEAVDSAWIFITILEGNHPPVAVDDTVDVIQGYSLRIYALENDSDPDLDSIFIKSVSPPVEGNVHISNDKTYIEYLVPDLTFAGIDSFEYVVNDKFGLTDTAMIIVTVKKPVAFEQTDIELDQMSHGAGLWVDYDMDGDMDILLAGNIGENDNDAEVKLYENNNGTYTVGSLFSDISPGQSEGVAWGDFDNDGDPDLIITGYENFPSVVTKLYRNDMGQFTEISTDIPGVSYGSVDWGDYDNDGDIDLLLTGNVGDNTKITKVYRNDGADTDEDNLWHFHEVEVTLPGVGYGSAQWGDYDLDGDLDILISAGSYPYSVWLYQNNGDNSFTSVTTGISNINGNSVWCDYNNDGYPDIIIAGDSSDGVVTKIFRNDASGQSRAFTDINAGLPGIEAGSVSCGDYDVDGDADILITGRTGDNEPITKLYENKGNDMFEEANVEFPGVVFGSATWADYNNDDRPDILLLGYQFDPAHPEIPGNRFTAIFESKAAGNNMPPETPSNLSAVISEDEVNLSWDAVMDAETPSEGLTYNLRIGTTSGGSEIVSAMAKVPEGEMFVPEQGNVGSNTMWTLKQFPQNTTFYWSVQAVDPSLGASPFATEHTFKLKTEFNLGVELYDQMENPVSKGKMVIWYKDEEGNPDHATEWDVTDASCLLTDIAEGNITLCFTPDRDMYPYLLRTYYEDNIFFRDALWFDFYHDMTGLTMIIPKLWQTIGTNRIRGLLRIVNSHDNMLKSLSETADDHSVFLYDSNGNVVKKDITASDGSFMLEEVPPGHYALGIDLGLVPMDAGNDSIVVTGDNEEYNVEAVSDGNSITVTSSGATGFSEPTDANGFTIYPNPIADNVYIKFNTKVDGNLTIKLFNVTGALVKEIKIKGSNNRNTIRVPLTNQTKGIYILEIEGKKMNWRTKFVKQ